MRDEGFDLLREEKLPSFPARQEGRVLLSFIDSHHGRFDELDPPQPLNVHVALVAGQQQTHRVTVGRIEGFTVLVERDHCVIHGFGDRNAAVHRRQVCAFGDQPFRLRVNADFFKQRGEQHAAPFRAGREPVYRLDAGLDRFLRIERRAVAAAFQESGTRHHRIAMQGIEGVDHRLLDQPMDQEAMLVRVDVGFAAAGNHEMQAVWRNRAVEELVRRACRAIARLHVGVAQGAHHLLFEFRRGWP
jgi:hypothetical protein